MGELSREDLEELLQWEAEAGGQPAPTEAEMAQMWAAATGHAGKAQDDVLTQARQSVEEWEQANVLAAQGAQQAVAAGQSVTLQ